MCVSVQLVSLIKASVKLAFKQTIQGLVRPLLPRYYKLKLAKK